ncbi:MAG TPA: dual specificity protein phosphatase [Pirellulales bacterium]|jgi:protein-tyrosine phosphatase|nr:dual specificity protein phosphatase [Pirellulales bacterium]
MNQMKDFQLWIGHAGDGRDLRGILEREIRAVVQLAIEEPPLQLPREIIAYRFPLLDGDGNAPDLLHLAVDAVAALIERSIPVLVCCGGGMSRSPAIVAAAISLVEQKDLHDCLKAVTESHPADVSPGLWDEICGVLHAPD